VLSYNVLSNGHPNLQAKLVEIGNILAPLFPELDQVTLRVRMKKLRKAVAEFDYRYRRIDIDPRPFDPDKNNLLPSVIAHETTHALQHADRHVPYGERSCDVYMLARLPANLYPKKRDFYVEVPQEILFSSPERIIQTARKAIDLREKGLKNYIVWFEKELRKSRVS
jgi:hypothetical protein